MQGPRAQPGPKNDINVTPLVDVVLVLLIIFMVITPMLQKGAEVDLPLTENPKKAKSVDEQVTITVKEDDRIYWEQDPVDEAELLKRLSEKISLMPTVPIFVKGDRAARYGRVRQVMKMIQDAGQQRIGIITKEPEKGAG